LSFRNIFITLSFTSSFTFAHSERSALKKERSFEENMIMLAVSETFGGWGIMDKQENMDGIQAKEK
jgi:hypothetical protein